MSALLAREFAPPYYAVTAHKGRRRAARLRPQPTPDGVVLRSLSARGVHDAVPALTAHPTALTAGVHFRRTAAYRFVLCHRDGHLLRSVETPFRIDGVVLLRRTRLGGPRQAAAPTLAMYGHATPEMHGEAADRRGWLLGSREFTPKAGR